MLKMKILTRIVQFLDQAKNALTPPPMRLRELMFSYFQAQVVHAVAFLEIPEYTADSPKTLEELATLTQADPDALGRLLRVSGLFGLTREVGARRYACTPVGQLLRQGIPGSMYSMAVSSGREWYGSMNHLPEAIRTGRCTFADHYGVPFFQYMAEHPDSARYYNDSMTEISRREVPAILEEYDFSSRKHVVDVAGGLGHCIGSILKKHPNLEGTLFDQESVIAKARTNTDLAARCNFATGNFFEEIPAGGDTYVMQRALHNWHDEEALKILKNFRRALPDDGLLLLFETAIRENESDGGRLNSDLLMLCMMDGRERDRKQFQELLLAAGLELKRIIPTRSISSIIEAVGV
jgi:ubiquinone/menaquinone biosynthesis C-methylase UbiE